MEIIYARNVNDAFDEGVRRLRRVGVQQDSRAGVVLVAPTPVMTVYERPTERVLFCPVRDANPFFHLFESLWMLGGRDDAEYLNTYVRDFGERFAQPEGHVHGAYGRRWRDWFPMENRGQESEGPCDQLDVAVRLLRENPDDRQVVIQMWDAQADLGVVGLKDRPCNTQVYLSVREVPRDEHAPFFESLVDSAGERRVLDLTVTTRSNDLVWGAYGANAVHFSVLQEYLAARIGVGVGRMYQLSNNWHAYLDVFGKKTAGVPLVGPARVNLYNSSGVNPRVMFSRPEFADTDVTAFLAGIPNYDYANEWFVQTAVPMREAHTLWRAGEREDALKMAARTEADDWRLAACQWMQRRMR